MKKIRFSVCAVLVMTAVLFGLGVYADEMPITVVVNNALLSFPDAVPFIDANDRTQVPVRFVSEALYAEVAWDDPTQTVTITKDGKVISLTIGVREIHVDGVVKTLDCEPVIVNDRTFVPIRFVSEALGASVTWRAATNTVVISTSDGGSIADKMKNVKTDDVSILDVKISIDDEDSVYTLYDKYQIEKKSGLAVMQLVDESIDKSESLLFSIIRSKKKDYGQQSSEFISCFQDILSDSEIANLRKVLTACNNTDEVDFIEVNTESYHFLFYADNGGQLSILVEKVG